VVHPFSSNDDLIDPAYAGRFADVPIPKNRMPDGERRPDAVYRLIHDELLLDGSSRLNMATFVTTWMEPEAEKLMAETFDKNMIDKDEYPQTAEIERRCVNIVADLFHAPAEGDAIGVSTIGSSEAVMLAGLAMKWKWRQRREAAGLPSDRPNMVMGSNVQVVWEKFCRYWDVEPRYVPITADCFTVTPNDVMARVDESTIGVIPILGTTYTGEYEPVAEIHECVVAYNTEHGTDIPIHVDAASGGFVAPFLDPDLEWDFRLPQVKSINVSGHKYGLTYPGIGFVVWRSADELPEDLVFHVNYLGGDRSGQRRIGNPGLGVHDERVCRLHRLRRLRPVAIQGMAGARLHHARRRGGHRRAPHRRPRGIRHGSRRHAARLNLVSR